jgi:hypothetical protein
MASQPEPPQLAEALDDYLEAVRSIDGPMPSPGASDADLDLVAAGVAPLPLPVALRTMWKRFQDPQLMPYPEWGTAVERLDNWRRERDEAVVALPVLFPIGSVGFALLLCADLTAPPELGVPLWEHEYVDGEARLRHRSLAAYYRAAAEGVRIGLVEWSFGRAAIADQRPWDEITARWNEEFAADDDLGVDLVDTNSPLAWPRRWQAAAGVDVELARPPRSDDDDRQAHGRSGRQATGDGRWPHHWPGRKPRVEARPAPRLDRRDRRLDRGKGRPLQRRRHARRC